MFHCCMMHAVRQLSQVCYPSACGKTRLSYLEFQDSSALVCLMPLSLCCCYFVIYIYIYLRTPPLLLSYELRTEDSSYTYSYLFPMVQRIAYDTFWCREIVQVFPFWRYRYTLPFPGALLNTSDLFSSLFDCITVSLPPYF